MKASKLISKLSVLIEDHGDMEIFFDCDSMLTDIASVGVLGSPYFDSPVLVISQSPIEQSK